ncbi:ABC transporter ATPase [Rhizobium leguminosarum]|nr:ABC transporter ATPase [Rhizobium leguminosarum]
MNEHKVNPANDKLTIQVLDEPGAGGANHHYMITTPDWTRAPDGSGAKGVWDINFQNGPINENGVNGVTQESLLAIVADRLRSFQAGQFACRENALALTKIEEAQHWLHSRTLARMQRGVEGTHKV